MAHLLCLAAFIFGFGILVKDAWYKSSDWTWSGLGIVTIALAGFVLLVGNERQAEKEAFLRTLKAVTNVRNKGCLMSLQVLINHLFPNLTTVLKVYDVSGVCELCVYLAASNQTEGVDPLFSVTVTNGNGFCFHHDFGKPTKQAGAEFLVDLFEKTNLT
jgi:hypothetical protein